MEYQIITPARLHFGLINQSGMLGRCNGGFGISISGITWDIEISHSEALSLAGIDICDEHKKSIKTLLGKFHKYIGNKSILLNFNSIIKPHCGLGSKTSLLLSVAQLVNHLFGLNLGITELISIVNRGGTSGVGINLFEGGGFIVDNGHSYEKNQPFLPSSSSSLNPARKIFSLNNGFFKVVFVQFSEGKCFGTNENQLFKNNCPVNDDDTKDIVCSLLFQIIPALIENNNVLLQKGMKEIQRKGFKKVEWGNQNDIENKFLEYWEEKNKESTLCLSSTGPGLFYIGTETEKAIKTIESFYHKPLEVIVSEINNGGSKINKI
jgi:beta-ribofuranosylaminobenzene 5'-phosphate synthase